jgi:hypothetical protein
LGKDALAKVKARGRAARSWASRWSAEASRATAIPLLDGDGQADRHLHERQPLAHHGQEHRPRLRARRDGAVGTKLSSSDCRGKAIEAVVVKTPFYKRTR